jgi:NAD(P)-dependent dehydrogenase (short-subunit alcohol dehydrogenase family)
MSDDLLNFFRLDGRVAVVTGAAMGIGRAIAVGLANAGADIVACDVAEEALAVSMAEIEATGRRAAWLTADVGDPEQIERLFHLADNSFGRVDILVNNVGLTLRNRPENVPLADWQRTLATGVTAAFLCSQQAWRRMTASGRGGSIINISSIAGASALGRGNLCHSVNKGALHMLTKELAVEWAKHGIRVNAILPCQVRTEGFQKWLDSPTFDPTLYERFLQGIPMGRLAVADDIVGPVIFLASDAAAMVTGALLPVDGGNLALNAGGSHTWVSA